MVERIGALASHLLEPKCFLETCPSGEAEHPRGSNPLGHGSHGVVELEQVIVLLA